MSTPPIVSIIPPYLRTLSYPTGRVIKHCFLLFVFFLIDFSLSGQLFLARIVPLASPGAPW